MAVALISTVRTRSGGRETCSGVATMIKGGPRISSGFRNCNAVRPKNNVAGTIYKINSSAAKAMSSGVSGKSEGVRTIGRTKNGAGNWSGGGTTTTGATTMKFAGPEITATVTGAGPTSNATNGGGAKSKPGANVKSNSGDVSRIDSVRGNSANSTCGKCVA